MSNPQGGIKKPSTLIEKEEAESSSVPTICHPICHLGDSSPASKNLSLNFHQPDALSSSNSVCTWKHQRLETTA